MRHEIAEQNRKEDHAEHLPVGRRFDDIRRHHAQEYFGNIAGILVRSTFIRCRRRRLKRQQFASRLAVRDSRGTTLITIKPDQNRGQRGCYIEQQRLATERAELAAGTDACDADDDRRGDQRHDDHLQAR